MLGNKEMYLHIRVSNGIEITISLSSIHSREMQLVTKPSTISASRSMSSKWSESEMRFVQDVVKSKSPRLSELDILSLFSSENEKLVRFVNITSVNR
jgi:hypothetical protein